MEEEGRVAKPGSAGAVSRELVARGIVNFRYAQSSHACADVISIRVFRMSYGAVGVYPEGTLLLLVLCHVRRRRAYGVRK